MHEPVILGESEDPAAVREVLPVPNLKRLDPEPPQLYDLSKDPGEQNDLFSERPDMANRLADLLEEQRADPA